MKLEIIDLGLIDFIKSWSVQKEIFEKVRQGGLESTLIVCRHYPVITLGRSAQKSSLLVGREKLEERGIPVYEIDRGGGATYHGPGQLTAYPIIDLNLFGRDIHYFLRTLENASLETLRIFSVAGQARPGLTGVWINNKKIASIAIAVKKWITYHGLSLNVKEGDLANFSFIQPCGMDIEMTSLESVLGERVDFDTVKKAFIRIFKSTLNSRIKSIQLAEALN
jgi:lipoate-protein ligase B